MREDVPWIVSQRLPTPAVCWQALSRHEAKPKAHRHCLCLVHEKRIPKGARDPRARPLGARGQKTSRNQGGRCPQCRSPLSLDCSPEQTALQMFRPVTIRGRAIEGQDIEARGGTSSGVKSGGVLRSTNPLAALTAAKNLGGRFPAGKACSRA